MRNLRMILIILMVSLLVVLTTPYLARTQDVNRDAYYIEASTIQNYVSWLDFTLDQLKELEKRRLNSQNKLPSDSATYQDQGDPGEPVGPFTDQGGPGEPAGPMTGGGADPNDDVGTIGNGGLAALPPDAPPEPQGQSGSGGGGSSIKEDIAPLMSTEGHFFENEYNMLEQRESSASTISATDKTSASRPSVESIADTKTEINIGAGGSTTSTASSGGSSIRVEAVSTVTTQTVSPPAPTPKGGGGGGG